MVLLNGDFFQNFPILKEVVQPHPNWCAFVAQIRANVLAIRTNDRNSRAAISNQKDAGMATHTHTNIVEAKFQLFVCHYSNIYGFSLYYQNSDENVSSYRLQMYFKIELCAGECEGNSNMDYIWAQMKMLCCCPALAYSLYAFLCSYWRKRIKSYIHSSYIRFIIYNIHIQI